MAVSTGAALLPAAFVAALLLASGPVRAQDIDCGQLRAQIAQADRGGRGAGGARRLAAELARAQGMAQQLGCGGGISSFFGGGDPRCGGLTQRIQQLQAGLAQQQGGAGGRADLVARFNAYCRGGQPQQAQQPQPRGFFDSLFGSFREEPRPAARVPDVIAPDEGRGDDDGDGDGRAHGGSQAVCVRTCDGGFFPLGVSARHDHEDLKQMCQALCPGTETQVYTRNPNAEISSAATLDGKPYSEMPNALKFTKAYVPDCSCKPADKSWAQALANADEVIGNTRKGDIVVTPGEIRRAVAPEAGCENARLHASRAAGRQGRAGHGREDRRRRRGQRRRLAAGDGGHRWDERRAPGRAAAVARVSAQAD